MRGRSVAGAARCVIYFVPRSVYSSDGVLEEGLSVAVMNSSGRRLRPPGERCGSCGHRSLTGGGPLPPAQPPHICHAALNRAAHGSPGTRLWSAADGRERIASAEAGLSRMSGCFAAAPWVWTRLQAEGVGRALETTSPRKGKRRS
ncbi:hypothetical protein AAFF_G00130150 [Aldrovandia affinis]|uniref:Uncharacterized protein n=1 Tax=Aldrovandia affinis TaxID=143900 RepID=A0AAD7W9E3_9TELE|nr:hypothetical protein AAFF_G00130150 [Aldrovandia affinis]